MTQYPPRPELNALLNAARHGLPLGTQLTGYELRDPDVVVLLASQPSMRQGEERKAAVRVTGPALADAGSLEPVMAAMKVLLDRARGRTLPEAASDKSAPMVAMYNSTEGLVLYDPPIGADD